MNACYELKYSDISLLKWHELFWVYTRLCGSRIYIKNFTVQVVSRKHFFEILKSSRESQINVPLLKRSLKHKHPYRNGQNMPHRKCAFCKITKIYYACSTKQIFYSNIFSKFASGHFRISRKSWEGSDSN